MGKNNSLFLWMEEWDDAELSIGERHEQLEEAVRSYNTQYDTNYNPRPSVTAYEEWKQK